MRGEGGGYFQEAVFSGWEAATFPVPAALPHPLVRLPLLLPDVLCGSSRGEGGRGAAGHHQRDSSIKCATLLPDGQLMGENSSLCF